MGGVITGYIRLSDFKTDFTAVTKLFIALRIGCLVLVFILTYARSDF